MDEKRQIFKMVKDGIAGLIAVLKKDVYKVSIEGAQLVTIKGKKGNDGYTPVKGKDYFTKEEVKDISEKILSGIKVPKDGKDGTNGTDGKDAIVDYKKIEKFVNSIEIKVPKDGKDAVIDYEKLVVDVLKKVPPTDIEPIKEYVNEQMRTLAQSLQPRVLRSGGPTTRLEEIADVSTENLTVGDALIWDGSLWVNRPVSPRIKTELATDVVQDGDDVTITIPTEAISIIFVTRQGQTLTPTTDYVISGSTITVFNGWHEDVFLLVYLY